MKKALIWGAAAFAVLIVIAAISADDPDAEADAPTTSSTPASPATEPSPTPEPEPEEYEPDPEPDGEYALASCDIDLGDNTRLLGSTQIRNTGEVPATITVKFSWLLGDGSAIKAKPKTVTIDVDEDRYVFFKTPVSMDTVSLFQDHPAYFDSDNCKTNAVIE